MAEEFDSVSVDQLQIITLAVEQYLSVANVNGKLFKSRIGDLIAFITPYIAAVSGSGLVFPDANNVLPNPTTTTKGSIVGAGTFTWAGGSLTTTSLLNIIATNTAGTAYVLVKAIDTSAFVTKLDYNFAGTYASVAAANTAIPNTVANGKNQRDGKRVDIGSNGTYTQYWWSGGTADTNLVPYTKVLLSGNMLDVSKVLDNQYINWDNGNIMVQGGFSTTGYVPCEANTTYNVFGMALDTFNHGIVYKDSSFATVGFADIGGSGTNTKPFFVFTTPANCSYFMLTIRTSATGDTTDITKVVIAKGSLPRTESDFQQTVGDVLGTKVLGVSNKTVVSKNLFNSSNYFAGYIYPTSGLRQPDPSYSATGSIRVIPNAFLTISGLSGNGYGRGFVWRGIDGAILTYGNLVSAQSYTIQVPANSYFFEMTLKTGSPTDTTDMSNVQVEIGAARTALKPYAKEIETIDGYKLRTERYIPTEGRKMLLFGDSITTTTGTSNWPTYAADIMKLKSVINYATSGAAYRDIAGVQNMQKISFQVQTAISENPNYDPDIIVANCGTNDGITSLGDYNTAMSKTSLASLDRTLLYEALRWAYWTLKTSYPSAVCFSCLPLQTANYEGSTTLANRVAITEMAKRYNFIVIDQNSESGIVKDFEVSGGQGRYLSDGLHPSENGKMLQARYLANKIITNYY